MTDARPDSPATTVAVDPAFLQFLTDRLAEEVVAAAHRRETASAESADVADRGVRILDELVATLDRGESPDQMSLDLLRVAYARHPEFRKEWNRWLQA
jgi:hypothetical protein